MTRPPATRGWLGVLLVLAAASMFALLGPLSRFAYERGAEPLPFVVWRAGIGAAILGAIVLALHRSGRAPLPGPLGRRAALAFVVATGTGFALNLALFGAFERITIALALLGFYLYPGMIALASGLIGVEPLTRRVVAALALALGGMVLVVAGGLDPSGELRIDPVGLLFALGAAACQTVFILVSRNGYPSLTAEQAMAGILAGTVAGGVVLAVLAGPATIAALGMPLVAPDVLAIVLGAGSIGAALPSLLFLRGIRMIGATRTGILMLFEPVVGVLLAAALLAETLEPVQLAGGAAILAAAVLLQRGGPRPVAPTPRPAPVA